MKDHGPIFPPPESGPPIANARLAVWLLVLVETMFFVGMLGAYVIVRKSAPTWPPTYLRPLGVVDRQGEPVMEPYRPPAMEATAPVVNAVVLTLGFAAALVATRAARRGEVGRAKAALVGVAFAGAAFLGGVVFEFVHEAGRGLTIHSGNYGSMLFLIIGAHAAHVLAALVWQFFVVVPALARPSAPRAARCGDVAVFWGFVSILWWVLLGILFA